MMETKQCARCGEVKPLESFSKRKASKDGLQPKCRECHAELNKAWYAANKDQCAAYDKAYKTANREQQQAQRKAWGEANVPRVLANNRARQAGLGQATPMWLSKEQHEAMATIYAEAAMLAAQTGVPHHVDHIVPLKGRGVCGLHVPWNLRAIPASENQSKSNKLMEHV